jgi:hypothetical protein
MLALRARIRGAGGGAPKEKVVIDSVTIKQT